MKGAVLVLVLLGLFADIAVGISCPNDCSGARGTCDEATGICQCAANYGGIDCSIAVRTLTATFPSVTNRVVSMREWDYYKVDLPSGEGLKWEVKSTKGDCDMYARYNELPTRSLYDQRDISGAVDAVVLVKDIKSGANYLGVFGYTQCAYSVTAFFISECPNQCSGNGQCNGNICQCKTDYYGADCSKKAVPLVAGMRQSNSVAAGYWNYYNANVNKIENVLFQVQGISANCLLDMYLGYNMIPSGMANNGSSTANAASFAYEMVRPKEGDWFIGIFGRASAQSCSYTIELTEINNCASNCSNHGTCTQNQCVCQSGYSGSYCENMENGLFDGEVVTGYITDDLWNYYSYLARTTDDIAVVLNETSQSSDCDLYIRKSERPTLTEFDYAENGLKKNAILTIKDPQFETWYIGVYGFQTCTYRLSAGVNTTCIAGCAPPSGTCAKDGSCICAAGYGGQTCQDKVNPDSGTGQVVSGSVESNKWKYFDVSNITGSYLVVELLEKQTVGSVWLFLNVQQYPTLAQSDFDDKETNTPFHKIVVSNVVKGATYVVGVYGSPFDSQTGGASFDLAVWDNKF
eukprot:TRINITY_DN6230_c0_g1_i1.p1 TRINITY_DN6230_c0_g1~~TRINITY_DN6230_c0_g1_i1.p1  ORF type:complete len:576 (-),score=88.08 TRINITY_DN6230_c0_g1_i1:72-1799(-)